MMVFLDSPLASQDRPLDPPGSAVSGDRETGSLFRFLPAGVLFLSILVTTGFYFYAVSFVQPVSDDFLSAYLCRTYPSLIDRFVAFTNSYPPGRLFYFAIASVFFQFEYWTIQAPGVGILALWGLVFPGLTFFLARVCFLGERGRWKRGGLLAASILAIYWATDPHPGELMFWLSFALYLIPLTAILVMAGLCSHDTPTPSVPRKRWALWGGLLVLSPMLLTSEVLTIFWWGGTAFLCGVAWIEKSTRWRFWFVLSCVAFAAILVIVLNGSLDRLQGTASQSQAGGSLFLDRLFSAGTVKAFVRDALPAVWNWFFSPPVIFVCLLLSLLPRTNAPGASSLPAWFGPVAILWLTAIVLGVMLILCVALGGINFRVWSLLQIIFHIGLFTLWRRAGWAVEISSPVTQRATVLVVFLLGLFLLFSPNNRIILDDIRQGRFKAFDRVSRQRKQILLESGNAGKKQVELPVHTHRPTFFYGYLDVGENPINTQGGTNQKMAAYYGLDTVVITRP
jgi:hypothetical protein